ncbi:recombinase family protein [Ruminococcus sp. CLA-AA-H200]|uniref:Recombinase family protein n=1 Tax=Ruminococcus turbiniformis TaxID=2881258 RepID=A0ABS8FT95_9FIRM|nr:recombinase family protein [Ruminococcus turbiniformis]MCC2253240.1 recombinase family protein [Ruminococcus turbiniformis]
MSSQKKILEKYALEHGYTNFKFYVDDGISGTTFNRPGFQQMIADIEAGLVKRVIIKDMSRFGRDYLQVGMYTEIMFPEHDIHFIAVNDGVDSTHGDNEFTPFRNIINEWYAKDTSKKIRAVMKVKGNAGEHLATLPPYGYMKSSDDKKQWVKDEEAAQVVYEIGLYIMDGLGPSQIARKLTERKILTPAAYYASKGRTTNVTKKGSPYAWDSSTIADIMDRWREYLGHTVNFKTRKKSYKSKKTLLNPESEWKIFENTHEAIWTEAIADAARLARQTRRRPTKMGEMGMFSGMMFCADCGSIMYQCRATNFRRDQEYYLCSGYRKSLYEDTISGKLSDERFQKLSADYEKEQHQLQEVAATLRDEIEAEERKSANVERFLSVVERYTEIPELTPCILHEFIEKIVVHAASDPKGKNRTQEIDIYYKGIGALEISKVTSSKQE